MGPIPNVHPLFVHFPIALLLATLVLDVVVLAGRRKAADGSEKRLLCEACSGAVLLLAALGGLAAVATGFLAEDAVEAMSTDAELHTLLERHETAALVTFGIALALAVWRLVGRLRLPGGPVRWVYLGLLLAACVLVGVTGHLGGSMVYGHGVGVQTSAP